MKAKAFSNLETAQNELRRMFVRECEILGIPESERGENTRAVFSEIDSSFYFGDCLTPDYQAKIISIIPSMIF